MEIVPKNDEFRKALEDGKVVLVRVINSPEKDGFLDVGVDRVLESLGDPSFEFMIKPN